MGGIVGQVEAFPRDENAYYHALNEPQLLDLLEIKEVEGGGLIASVEDATAIVSG